MLWALRDAGVKKIALRASGLSAEVLEYLSRLVTRLRKSEGLAIDVDDGTADTTDRD